MRRKTRWVVAPVVFVVLTFVPGAWMQAVCRADDVTDTINEAVQQYKAGKYHEAAGTLDYAAELIRQKRSQTLRLLLPEPPAGWSADEATSQTLGTAVFGGMVSAERRYAKGDASVTVKIVTDSPLLQSMIAVFANPMIAGMSGSEVVRVKGQKALIRYSPEERKGELNVVVANRFLVTLEGHGVKREDLVGFASAVPYEKLESF